MNETIDREKKIAEIRNWCEIIHTGRVMTRAKRWIRFLLSELDREREESRKLREERDKLIEVLRWYADKTNYVQEVHHLRHGTLIGPAEAIYYDEGQRARDILHEIGANVE
jgi:hypothetical protein